MFEQSKSKWEQFGNESRVTECQENIAVCQKEIANVNRIRMIIIAAVIGVIAVVQAIFVMKKRST